MEVSKVEAATRVTIERDRDCSATAWRLRGLRAEAASSRAGSVCCLHLGQFGLDDGDHGIAIDGIAGRDVHSSDDAIHLAGDPQFHLH